MESDEDKFFLLIAGVGVCIVLYHQLLLQDVQERYRRRRWWIRPVNRPKEEQGCYNNLILETQLADHEEFFANFRMWPEQFQFLHNIVGPLLEKQKTVMRQPLPSKLRLGMTLMYLAQGGTIHDMHSKFRVGKSTVHKVIEETCEAIWEKLQPIYLPQPTRNDFERSAEEFFELWQLPNCVGVIDGRHMRIKAPPTSGSEFYNYKGFFSIVLLAAVDAHYKFIWVDVGQYGSISDGGVWSNSDLGKALEHGEVDFPLDTPLPKTNIPFPYFFVGDEAFPLKKYLMRPFPGRLNQMLSDEQRIFNYRLSRARRVSENAFGILTMRWQVLNSALTCSVKKSEDIVKAIVCLHNMLMDNKDGYANNIRLETELQDGQIQTGDWTTAQDTDNYFRRLGRVGANRAASIVNGMRNHLAEYLVSDIGTAQAPWQFERAFRGACINFQ